MRVLTVSNFKGGVGKTTTATNLAVLCAQKGLRTLIIDLDPQASATDYYNLYDKARTSGRTPLFACGHLRRQRTDAREVPCSRGRIGSDRRSSLQRRVFHG